MVPRNMSVTSVFICRRILPRFCSSGKFFAFCYYSRLLEQHYTLSDGKRNNNNVIGDRELIGLPFTQASTAVGAGSSVMPVKWFGTDGINRCGSVRRE